MHVQWFGFGCIELGFGLEMHLKQVCGFVLYNDLDTFRVQFLFENVCDWCD